MHTMHTMMHTISEAWNLGQTPIYDLPRGATREYGRDNLIRVLQANERAWFQGRINALSRLVGALRQMLLAPFDRMIATPEMSYESVGQVRPSGPLGKWPTKEEIAASVD